MDRITKDRVESASRRIAKVTAWLSLLSGLSAYGSHFDAVDYRDRADTSPAHVDDRLIKSENAEDFSIKAAGVLLGVTLTTAGIALVAGRTPRTPETLPTPDAPPASD